MVLKWNYYLRDDALVFKANSAQCLFWGLAGWTESSLHGNEPALLEHSGTRLEKISKQKADRLNEQ